MLDFLPPKDLLGKWNKPIYLYYTSIHNKLLLMVDGKLHTSDLFSLLEFKLWYQSFHLIRNKSLLHHYKYVTTKLQTLKAMHQFVLQHLQPLNIYCYYADFVQVSFL